jgi:hypothetical protein
VICPTGKKASRAKTCPAVSAKIFRFAIAPNHIYSFRRPGPPEGRIAIVTDVGHGMRWTHIAGRNVCATSGGCADGEVVWSWRSDAGAKLAKTLMRLAGDGGNQAWSPGRSRISCKTVAQGRPDDRPHLWFCRVLFVARGPWVRAGTRPSLRPLVWRERISGKSSGAMRGEDAGVCQQSCCGPSFETALCASSDRMSLCEAEATHPRCACEGYAG